MEHPEPQEVAQLAVQAILRLTDTPEISHDDRYRKQYILSICHPFEYYLIYLFGVKKYKLESSALVAITELVGS